MAKIYGAVLSTPDLTRMLRDCDRTDDSDPPQARRLSLDELTPLLKRFGLGPQHTERASRDFGRRSR